MRRLMIRLHFWIMSKISRTHRLKWPQETVKKHYSAAMLKKDDAEVAERISKALEELKKEGKLKEISMKYFGEDVSQ